MVQVFKTFCGDLTRTGMENIFRIIKKGTKSVRHEPVVELDEEGSEEDDDMLGLHDDEGSEEEAGSEDDDDDEVEEVEEITGDGRLVSLKHTVSCLCYISIFIQLSGIFKIFRWASFLMGSYCCSFMTVASLL